MRSYSKDHLAHHNPLSSFTIMEELVDSSSLAIFNRSSGLFQRFSFRFLWRRSVAVHTNALVQSAHNLNRLVTQDNFLLIPALDFSHLFRWKTVSNFRPLREYEEHFKDAGKTVFTILDRCPSIECLSFGTFESQMSVLSMERSFQSSTRVSICTMQSIVYFLSSQSTNIFDSMPLLRELSFGPGTIPSVWQVGMSENPSALLPQKIVRSKLLFRGRSVFREAIFFKVPNDSLPEVIDPRVDEANLLQLTAGYIMICAFIALMAGHVRILHLPAWPTLIDNHRFKPILHGYTVKFIDYPSSDPLIQIPCGRLVEAWSLAHVYASVDQIYCEAFKTTTNVLDWRLRVFSLSWSWYRSTQAACSGLAPCFCGGKPNALDECMTPLSLSEVKFNEGMRIKIDEKILSSVNNGHLFDMEWEVWKHLYETVRYRVSREQRESLM